MIKDDPQIQIDKKIPVGRKKLIFVFIASLLILFAIGGYFFWLRDKSETQVNPISSNSPVSDSKAVPAPFLFQELTIPYLRSRNFESSLGDLKNISDNGEYTSYLTSYTSDGLKINGLLTQPKGEIPTGGWPAIIFVHGYIPPSQYQTQQNYSAYVDYLARNGLAVFKIDLRGHGNSEGEASGAYYSSDYIIDVLNAYSALGKSSFVNPEKIGLWGHSMAGNVISRALAVKPSISAISIWAGAVYTYEDFSEFSIEDNSYQPPPQDSPARKKRNELFEKYGQFDPDSEFWKQVPMTNHLDDIRGAIQLNHAVDDNVVDIRYSRNFNNLLDKTSIEHELNEYSSGGHNLSRAVFNQAMQDTVRFFRENL